MKKLLTVLLALVLAIGLVVLNNNYTKAEESNSKHYKFTYKYVDYTNKWIYTIDDGAETEVPLIGEISFNSGDVVEFKNINEFDVALITINTKQFVLTDGKSSEQYTVINDNAKIYNLSSNFVFLIDYEDTPVECEGISFINGVWKNGNTTLDSQTKLDPFGIVYTEGTGGNPGTAKLTKNLISSAFKSTLDIKDNLNIVIEKNITIIHTGSFPTLSLSKNSGGFCDIGFNSNGNTLTLIGADSSVLRHYGGNLSLDNITLDIYGNCKNGYGATNLYRINNATGEMQLSNDSKIVINSCYDAPALRIRLDKLPLSTGFKVYGAENNTDLNLKEAKPKLVASGEHDYYVDVNGSDVIAKYIVIKKDDTPVPPQPDPSPKDESCEKVIGPTWHWNNDKGICEEYATVGTATR